MEQDRDKVIGQEAFISYLNDDGVLTSGWVTILELNGFVKFRTNANVLIIPRERVLKIKLRGVK